MNAASSVTVTLTPAFLGPKSATVTFTTNAATSPDNAPLTGIGVASGMVLYPASATHRTRQINIFDGPINVDDTDYSHLIGGSGILNGYTAETYITGVTTSLNLGCTAASCTGAAGTYLDHVNAAGGLGGGSCPTLVFNTGSDAIDTFTNAVAALAISTTSFS